MEERRCQPKCDMRERLDEIERGYIKRADRNAKAIHNFSRKTLVILIVLAILTAISGVASVYLIGQNGKRADEIQRERAEAVRTNCEQQNARHDAAVRRFDEGIAALTDPARRVRAERSRAFTISLIDALAPKRNCERLVEQSVPSASRHG